MPALFYGLIASMFALVLQLLVWIPYPELFLLHPSLTPSTLVALIVLAACEEFARLLFFIQYALRYSVTSPLQNGLTFGIGFAVTEGILALYQPFSYLVFGVITLHIVLGILLAFACQKYLSKYSRHLFFIALLVLMTLLHLGYNVSIFLFT